MEELEITIEESCGGESRKCGPAQAHRMCAIEVRQDNRDCRGSCMSTILIEDLLKIDGNATPDVTVDGYFHAGDGGGGDFKFFPNDTATADKGLVFAPEATVRPVLPPGRWPVVTLSPWLGMRQLFEKWQ